MERKNLSIIIPCYNSEKTVAKTIGCFLKEFKSVTKQDSDFKYEIIVVDDGSTDNTVLEIERISDGRIILLQKENSGVSDSRNFGLKHASGEYVWFFDSDDLLFEGVGQKIYEYLSQSPDIIRFNSVTVDSKTRKNVETFNNCNKCKILYRGKYKEFLNSNKTGFSCWSIIIKGQLLIDNNILFNQKLSIGEDVLWNLSIAKALSDADLLTTNLNVVKYIVNSNSIVNTINPIANYRYYKNSIQLYQYLDSFMPLPPYMELSLQHYKTTTVNQIITRFLSCKMYGSEIKAEVPVVDNILIKANINNLYSKVYKILSKNTYFTYLSQNLYRNIFLKYIKPHIGRN